jgi:hypothetical protein
LEIIQDIVSNWFWVGSGELEVGRCELTNNRKPRTDNW